MVLGPIGPPSVEELLWRWCVTEARREVRSWFTGAPYVWVPFNPKIALERINGVVAWDGK